MLQIFPFVLAVGRGGGMIVVASRWSGVAESALLFGESAMKKKRVPFTLTEAVRVAAWVGADAYSVYKPSIVESIGGIDKKKLEWFIRSIVSDTSDLKRTIFAGDGSVVESCVGINASALLSAAYSDLSAKPVGVFFGRGRTARSQHDAVKARAAELGIAWPNFNDDGVEVLPEGQTSHPTDPINNPPE